MSNAGKFRADLYYRLNGFTITVPPLRERGDDIVLLLDRFFTLYARQLGKEVQGIAPDALKLLVEYPWPGNVREMQSAVRRALLQTTGPVLLAESLPEEIRTGIRQEAVATISPGTHGALEHLIESRLHSGTTDLYAEAVTALDKCLLTRVLRLTAGNQSQAARILGITRGSLRHKIHALNIQIESVVVLEDEPDEDAAVLA
jgi:two-component system nitrogen regulation response regulator GlnG